jgi:hypothetical protein
LLYTDISFSQAKRFFKFFAFVKRGVGAMARINSSWFFYEVRIFYIFEGIIFANKPPPVDPNWGRLDDIYRAYY